MLQVDSLLAEPQGKPEINPWPPLLSKSQTLTQTRTRV